MCIMLESEVILANILSQSQTEVGIDMDDIINYCKEVKSTLSKTRKYKNEYVYFDVNEYSIKNTLGVYNNKFVEFGEKIFKLNDINIEYFNSRFTKDIASMLIKAAINSCKK